MISWVSHKMPALNLALNANFEKKALLSTFRALFALFYTETGGRLMKTWNLVARRLQLCALKKAIFSSSSVLSHCLVVADHCCWWKLTLVNVATLVSFMFQYNNRGVHALVDCDVHCKFAKCCCTDKSTCTTWCHMLHIEPWGEHQENMQIAQRILACHIVQNGLYTLSSNQWWHRLPHNKLPSHHDSVWKASSDFLPHPRNT